jgi:L-lactate dehydrogenase
MNQPKLKTTIAVIGCGDVGATLAYTLILQSICTEVILVDPKTSLLQGQVRDLKDATCRGTKIRAGTHAEAGQADIIVITAGAKQKHGESRLSLLSRNLHILSSIFGALKPICPHAVLLLIANPVGISTYSAHKISGLPETQVLGLGTSLLLQRDVLRIALAIPQQASVDITSSTLGPVGSLSLYQPELDSCLSMPAVIGRVEAL